MGICYYLVRRDVRTIYDLGKALFLQDIFGKQQPMRVSADDVDTLVAQILAAQYWELPETYWRAVVLDVVDWSEGHPFEFHSENSSLLEDIEMDGWDHDPPLERLCRTGDRHNAVDGRGLDREDLARRRQHDEAFRRGLVWVDKRSGMESVRDHGDPLDPSKPN